MKSIIIGIIILSGIFSACKKEKEVDTSIQGMVLEYNSNTSVPKAKVKIDAQSGQGAQFYPDSTTTDSSGNYVFNVKLSKKYNYYIMVEKELYLLEDEIEFTPGKNNQVNVYMHPPGWIKANVKNVNKIFKGICIFSGGCSENTIMWGADIDTSIIENKIGNKTNSVSYFLYDNNKVGKLFQQSIYCSRFDTVDIDIHY